MTLLVFTPITSGIVLVLCVQVLLEDFPEGRVLSFVFLLKVESVLVQYVQLVIQYSTDTVVVYVLWNEQTYSIVQEFTPAQYTTHSTPLRRR